MAKTSFLKRLQSTPKIKAVRAKIKKKRSEMKSLSIKYKRLVKSESKRLSK